MNNKDQLKRIEKYKEAGANIIPLCEWERLPELHQLIVEEVKLSPKPDDKDVYVQDKKLAIHFQGLTKLALAAGLEWEVDECKAVTSTSDYTHYQAVGCIRREYGKRICFKGDAEMDMLCVREDLVDEYKAKAEKDDRRKDEKSKKAYVDFCVNRDFRFKRKHKLKLTATSAKSVVINKILGLKGGYTAAELLKPFVIVRCVVAPDLSDTETKQRLLSMSLQSIAGIYGRPAPEPAQIEDDRFNGGDVIDLPYDDSPMPEPPPMDEPPPRNEETPPPDPPPRTATKNPAGMSSAEADFMAADKNSRIETIRALAERTGYDLVGFENRRKQNIDLWPERTMVDIFKHLSGMPGKENK